MIEDVLSQGNSPLHRLDARAKLVAATALAVATAMLHSLDLAWSSMALSTLLLVVSLPPVAHVIKRLAVVNTFILFLWFFLPLSAPGEVAIRLGPLTFSREGFELAKLITIKSNAIVIAFMALVGTITIPDMGHALRKLKVPGKLAYLLVFTYRYIFVIGQETARMRAALKVRGFKPGTNLHTYRTYAYMLGMIIVRSMDRADRVYSAMLCRGFAGRFHSINGMRMRLRDIVFLVAMLAAATWLATRHYLY